MELPGEVIYPVGMRGVAILALLFCALYLVGTGGLAFSIIPAIGLAYLIYQDRGGHSIDGAFVSGWYAVIVLVVVAGLKVALDLL